MQEGRVFPHCGRRKNVLLSCVRPPFDNEKESGRVEKRTYRETAREEEIEFRLVSDTQQPLSRIAQDDTGLLLSIPDPSPVLAPRARVIRLFSSRLIPGQIPQEIGNLTLLEKLFLGQNRLTGERPTDLPSACMSACRWATQLINFFSERAPTDCSAVKVGGRSVLK